jgi:excisionase family DNA binding protein
MRTLKIGRQKIRQYTVKDIMDKLDISKVTALNLINSGKLNSVRIGRQHWINEDDLIAFLLDKKEEQSAGYKKEMIKKIKNPLIRFIVNLLLK